MAKAAAKLSVDSEVKPKATINLAALWNKVKGSYYTYPGSLTTPTCNEVVYWIVMKKSIYIAESEVNTFT